MNLVPVIKLHGQGFLYPVCNISYSDNSFIIHDLKLSSYFRGSNCIFLYDFKSPVTSFNVSNVTESLSSGQGFFNCEPNGYDFDGDVFKELYNLSFCEDYGLGYGEQSDDGLLPGYCATSSDLWFDWRLAFDDDGGGGVSLISAGFSRKWTSFPDCFDCRIVSGNCSAYCRGIEPSGKSRSIWIIAGVVSGVGGFLLACTIFFFCYKYKLKKKYSKSLTPSTAIVQDFSSSFSKKDSETISFHCQTPLFSYEELVEATNGFDRSKELGDGGYGTVYKGLLRDGRVVAVKRLYERSTSLPLSLRLSAAIDTASALSYLHSIDIIHRDVKTHNILVDNNFNAKVADFGLSRLFPANATHVSTAPQGTPGYLDPEYHRFYQLTDKSDVYSFGVVLMELISSRPAVDVNLRPNEISLAMATMSKIQNGELADLVDPGLEFGSNQEANRMVTQMAELAFRCLQMDRDMRPPIKEVLEGLKEIEAGSQYCNGDNCEVRTKEESRLLKDSGSISPDSVMKNCWMSSSSTTPSSSNQGIV
ncbi:LOW QUALITY PROTEIN: LEAF RUST 10 DISEASE-RESISTANCE LOCUS RECEPTOR-LIKE PROTEIN KINASE-like 1.1 [Asparagus officinalis]|uniref:LOW QUALITY PROTEIN: LEAF RUST 10 DISEASE-RESISTANCE LOCUS RECEPTOR-LIKE PROTEIN KINASE-like 1.1 n=1 Tax=Asparagus officinalis TaxID=4686 RepID=UPI00098E5021|nr:LOW QUALITY PROTEIN: LEAF RUST 10 DISEASE-RESISTANCE LOCUS RECEPTOR-LIKE PROTEIN KINASE-like 1.1 [Asparagus officinalis]